MTVHPPDNRPPAPQVNQCKITQSTGIATRMQIEESLSHPHFAKQRQLKSQERRKREAEIVYESMLSKVLSLD